MNPLLDTSALPRFGEIEPEHALPAIRQLIAAHRQKLAEVLVEEPSFDALVTPLEDMAHELSRVWSPIGHLHSVLGDAGWREAYNECLALVTEHFTDLGQNTELQKAFEKIARGMAEDASETERRIVKYALRDFHLAGVDLPDDHKDEYRDLRQRLAATQARFEQNLQDATDAWHLDIADETRLRGLPQQIIERARNDGSEHDVAFRLHLDFPTYQAVISHADDRELRREFYRAWSTRASDQADDDRWNNAETIEEVLALRHRLAELVGFDNYADYSLATKMADSVVEVTRFLDELAERTRSAAQRELSALQQLADEPLEAWDVNYYLENLKEARYSMSDQQLRPYFPVRRVVEGLFGLADRLYQIEITRLDDIDGWHDTIDYYEVRDRNGDRIGGFYADLFARTGKRAGAWIDECIVRKNLNGDTVLPVGYLVCNFSPPDDSGVSLLTHTDVVTLFHEFGHMLHHLLTKVDYPSIAGINGVPWDAVELPSQFMENFAWTYDVLREASGHVDSGEPLPKSMFEKLEASRYCGAALAMLRQLEFALYDFRIHAGFDPTRGARTLETLDEVRKHVSVLEHPEFNRFPMSFSHIFAGGYAAGYYSYKWAEVLAADAFAAFEEQGIFDAPTAARFRQEILEVGGSRDIMRAFIAFRGRKPELDALLRRTGIGLAA